MAEPEFTLRSSLLPVCEGGGDDGEHRFIKYLLCGNHFKYLVSFSSRDGPVM